MNRHSSTWMGNGPIMGTDIDAALDEVYYGRHNRHDGGLPASLGARTSYDIKYAHQRLLAKRAREQKAFDSIRRFERARAPKPTGVSHHTPNPSGVLGATRFRQDVAGSEMLLWQEEGWEKWWALLRLAARKPEIRSADRDELDAAADRDRYLLLKTLVIQVAAEWGFTINMAKAVAASIYVRGLPQQRDLDAREEHIRRSGSLW